MSIGSTTLRNELLQTAKSLTEESPTGIFLTTPDAIEQFTSAASRLEAITPPMTNREKEMLIGDWELIATTRQLSNIKASDITKNLPFNIKTPPKLSDSIRNSVTVLQRIRTDGNGDGSTTDINRIDHVIEYTPLTLSDLIPESSPLSAIRNLNLNPLEVSQSKVVLIHNAEIESVEPALRTKLGLKSVILNVAGKSQYLEADGADIFGLNIPSLGDFANSGCFDSTYVDENVRVSKGTIGFLEEVRVFVRKDVGIDAAMKEDNVSIESIDEKEDEINVESEADVEEKTEESMEAASEADAEMKVEAAIEEESTASTDEAEVKEEVESSTETTTVEPVAEENEDAVEAVTSDEVEVVEEAASDEVDAKEEVKVDETAIASSDDEGEEALETKKIESMTSKELKKKLKAAGLSTKGQKKDLIKRLQDAE